MNEEEIYHTTTYLIKIFVEYILHQFVDHKGVFLPVASQEARVGEMIEIRSVDATAGLPLPLVEEESVTLGLDLALHHLLQVIHSHVRPRIRKYFRQRTLTQPGSHLIQSRAHSAISTLSADLSVVM